MIQAWIARRGQDLSAAFGLLTRIPVPQIEHPRGVAASAWAWPLIGALLGLIAALVAALLLQTGLPAIISAILVTGLLLMMTGALHEDGLADCADGLPYGGTAAERIRIMRDSRIGAYGTLALILVIVLRIVCIEAILLTSSAVASLVITGAFSRGAMAVAMALISPATPEGLSSSCGQPTPAACMIITGSVLGLVLLLAGPTWLAPLALSLLPIAGFCLYAHRRIGGQTGDVLGAVQILTELACLLSIVIMTR